MTIKYLRNLTSTTGAGGGGDTTADFQQVLKANFTNNVTATVGVSRYYPPAQMNISQIYASVGTVSTSPITVDIKVNGTSILGTNLLTIPANQFISAKRAVTLLVLSTSYITVDVVTGGGTDLIVYMVYRFAEAASTPTPSPSPAPTPADTNSNYNILMLRGTGTNNSTNNTITDSSSNNFTVTRFGNVTQGSFSPFSTVAGYWSNYFDGTGDYLSIPANAAFGYGTGDFTIEFWLFMSGGATNQSIVSNLASAAGSNPHFYFKASDARIYYYTSSADRITGSVLNIGTWYHIALARASGSTRLFVNGVQSGSTYSDSNNYGASAPLGIGTYWEGASPVATSTLNGYISNLRIVKGTALYTANFTTPTSPLTSVSGATLLTCQNNRFVDNSANVLAITQNGNASISALSPFVAANAYSSSSMGGSLYFDGAGDYITAPSNAAFAFGTGDFTLECWAYMADGPYLWLFDFRTTLSQAVPALYVTNYNTFNYYVNGANRIAATISNSVLNRWVHIAISRSSSNTRLFVDGVQVGSTWNDTTNYEQAAFKFGTNEAGNFVIGSCYVSNIRAVKGTAVYTSNFSPLSPVTAISGTSILLNGTNAAIVDASVKNNLETVGDTKISTVQSKWGTGSMYFDGTGDYLTAAPNPNYAFGTGNFTIECWVYPADVSGGSQRGILQTSTSAGGLQAAYADGVVIYFGARLNGGGNGIGNVATINGGLLAIVNNKVVGSTSTSAIITVNQWSHIALVRNNGTLTLYFNGTSIGSVASTENITAQNLCVGGYYNAAYLYNGYMNDLRITKGIARYTANFTPPTAL